MSDPVGLRGALLLATGEDRRGLFSRKSHHMGWEGQQMAGVIGPIRRDFASTL